MEQLEEEKNSEKFQLGLFISGSISLAPLLIVTAGVLCKKNVRKTIKSILFISSIFMISIVAATALIYFALSTQYYPISLGDQILVGQDGEGYLTQELRHNFCETLEISSDEKKIRVWPVNFAPNELERNNYTIATNAEKLIYLNLKRGDSVSFEGYPKTTKFNIKRLTGALVNVESIETSDKLIENQDYITHIEQSSRYVIQILGQGNSEKQIIKLRKKRYSKTNCEITACEYFNKNCDYVRPFKRFVIDFTMNMNEKKPYASTKVRIKCNIKWWVISMTFGCGPLLFIIIFAIITTKSCKNQRRDNSNATSITRENFGYDGKEETENGYI